MYISKMLQADNTAVKNQIKPAFRLDRNIGVPFSSVTLAKYFISLINLRRQTSSFSRFRGFSNVSPRDF